MTKPTSKKDARKPEPINPLVEVSFVFVDKIKAGIEGLSVKIEGGGLSFVGTTDKDGHAVTATDAKRNMPIRIFVRKRNGDFDSKGTVTPKRDVNAYTIKSPELHFEATTKLSPKEELEEDLKIPRIAEGELLTASRLFGDLAPFIGSAQVVTEVGKVVKDFPTKKSVNKPNATTGSVEKTIEIEHHYKVIKTDRPTVTVINLLGSRLNYPTSTEFSKELLVSLAKEFDCEVAAIRAVMETETGGEGFLDNGLPKILFERHHFYELTKPKNKKTPHPYTKFPDICHPNPGSYGKDGVHQYVRLIQAVRLDKDAAIMSCSWGGFQVLAEYWKALGYKSVTDLVDDCMKSMDGHANLFRGFLKMPEKKQAIAALKAKEWEKFTAYYNGGGWKKQNPTYPAKMAAFYETYK